MFEYILKKLEKEKLLKLCEKVNSSPKNIEIFLKEAKEAAHELPESLKEILYEFKHSEYAALLLKNLYMPGSSGNLAVKAFRSLFNFFLRI